MVKKIADRPQFNLCRFFRIFGLRVARYLSQVTRYRCEACPLLSPFSLKTGKVMIRRTITRACLVSMLTVGTASQVSALQSFDQAVAPAASPVASAYSKGAQTNSAPSILEPILAVEHARTQINADITPEPNVNELEEIVAPVESTFASGMFAELESMVAASLQLGADQTAEDTANSVNANFELAADETLSYRVSQVTALLPDKKSTPMSSVEAESAILIHPPESRASSPNRHFFKIENTSPKVAKNVVIELVVPNHAHIIEVFPYETVVVGKTARYKFDSIAPGDSETVELTTNPSAGEDIVFESRFSLEHVRHLAARSKPHKVNVWAEQKRLQPIATPKSKSKVEERKKVTARTVSAGPKMNVQSAEEARKKWQAQSRLSYGQVGIPGKVMVANPQIEKAETPTAKGQNVSEVTAKAPSVMEEKTPETSSRNMVESQPIPVADDVTPQVSATSTDPENGWFKSQLKTKIDGPQHAVTGEEAEYQVSIENASTEDVDDVLVQLAIPTGIEVTVLDRDAWFDGKARTITWKLPKVAASSEETIRYLAKMVSSDGHLQKVTLGVDNQFRGQAIFQSTVLDQYELAAPLPPFEPDARSLK
jgi:uncharacterized repeat protein (TIGR01451 family)